MDRLFSLAYLTLPGVEPLEQIRIAEDTGYDCVGLRTIPMGLPGEPQLRLEKDPEMMKKIRNQLRDCGIQLLDIELVRIREDQPDDYRAAFAAGAELGAKHVLSSVWTEDFDFAADRYATICQQAAEFGLDVNLEFPAVSCLTHFSQAVEMQERVGMPNLKVFVDTLYGHLDGLTPDMIRSIDPDRYGLIHLCDCPVDADKMELTQVVRECREYCGQGQVNLVSMLKALPAHPCAIELPNLQNVQAYGLAGHAARCLNAAKELFRANGL